MKEYLKKYKLYIIIGVSILILSVGGTLAYYIWSSNTNAIVNTEVCTPEMYFVGGSTVNGTDMVPVLSKEEGLTKQIEVKVNNSCKKGTIMSLYLDLETFPTELADTSFVYELYKNGTKVVSSNFANREEGNIITLISDATVTSTKDTYTLYVYIDGNQDNPGTMAGKNFLFKLWASGQGAIYKENVMGDYSRSSIPDATTAFLGSAKARNAIQLVVSEDNNVVPSDAIESVDISSSKDGSVMLWYTDTDSNGLYEAHIGSSNGIIKLNTSASYLFANLTKAESIDLSAFDTSNVTDMSEMFLNCGSLTSLNLTSFDTSNVTSMTDMFYNCSSLTSLDLSAFDTSNVTDMSEMFLNCGSLISLNLSNFDTSNVTSMNRTFYNCSSLTSLNLSSFDTSNVTNMAEMFSKCSSLTSLDLSSFNTPNVTSMTNMFYNCRSLTNLNLSNFNTSKVTYMNFMFFNCDKLTSLDLSSFNTSKVTNMNSMFYSCSKLKTIYVSDLWNTSSVTSSPNMFYWCASLVGAVPYDSTKIDKTMANYTTGYLTYKSNN